MTNAFDDDRGKYDLGYYSEALEAAKSWPQSKGTLPLFMNPVTGAIVPLTGNAFDER